MLKSWPDSAQKLVDVAMGRSHADMVIRGGRWVNVYSGEIIPGTDVAIADGRFAYVGEDASHTIGSATKVIAADGRYLVPGFVDCQVNGGGGALFNDDPGIATIRTIAAAPRRFGTTALLPTLISEDFAVISRAIDAVREAIKARVPGVAGIHVEGPFINEARRGVKLR